jgi:hypothetical protein
MGVMVKEALGQSQSHLCVFRPLVKGLNFLGGEGKRREKEIDREG